MLQLNVVKFLRYFVITPKLYCRKWYLVISWDNCIKLAVTMQDQSTKTI